MSYGNTVLHYSAIHECNINIEYGMGESLVMLSVKDQTPPRKCHTVLFYLYKVLENEK